MNRHRVALGSVASLLLCVAVCVFWVRSYRRADAVRWTGTCADWTVHSNRGRLTFSRLLHEAEPGDRWHVSSDAAYTPVEEGFAGFSHVQITYDRGIFADTERQDVGVPHWFVAGLLAIGPALWLRTEARRRREHHPGRCVVCGYDLRATPTRCPECGATSRPARASRETPSLDERR